MSGGQFSVPLVTRMATGAGRQLAAQHSHSLENWYAHVPGIKVLTPATAQDAHDALLAALADPDPVFIFEHQTLYPVEGELDEGVDPKGVWRAVLRRPGKDLSLITYGGCVAKALVAAEQLAAAGIDAEVLDLRCLRPLDDEAIAGSVQRTHRVLIVDEGWKTGSLSAEIAARLAERWFYELDAPIARVCSAEVPIPYAQHLEQAALPQPDKIVAAAKALMESHA
jgi:pyruvate dehydrogenase E1 component beta subunit